MVDLEMMAAVLAALPPGARLVLLGDKDQLASVEAGAVLGELCRRAQDGPLQRRHRGLAGGRHRRAGRRRAHRPAGRPIDQAVAMLRHSYRFGGDSGIGQLAAAVNAGSGTACAGPGPRPRRPHPAGAGRRGRGARCGAW